MTDAAPLKPIRVLAIDDHPVLLDGLSAMIEPEPDIELVGEARNGVEGVEAFRRLNPDVTLMDLQMPVMSGIDAISAIRREDPGARIIVLTTYEGEAQAVRALKAGASGYLLKSALRRELLDTIRLVHGGGKHVPADIAQEIAFYRDDEALSSRELNILALVAMGKANKQIAWELAITEDTVKSAMKSIFAKLHVADRTHAVIVASRRGMLEI